VGKWLLVGKTDSDMRFKKIAQRRALICTP